MSVDVRRSLFKHKVVLPEVLTFGYVKTEREQVELASISENTPHNEARTQKEAKSQNEAKAQNRASWDTPRTKHRTFLSKKVKPRPKFHRYRSDGDLPNLKAKELRIPQWKTVILADNQSISGGRSRNGTPVRSARQSARSSARQSAGIRSLRQSTQDLTNTDRGSNGLWKSLTSTKSRSHEHINKEATSRRGSPVLSRKASDVTRPNGGSTARESPLLAREGTSDSFYGGPKQPDKGVKPALVSRQKLDMRSCRKFDQSNTSLNSTLNSTMGSTLNETSKHRESIIEMITSFVRPGFNVGYNRGSLL